MEEAWTKIKKALKALKMTTKLKIIGIILLIAMPIVVILLWFSSADISTEGSAKAATHIENSASIVDGKITIDEDVYDKIRKELKDSGFDPDEYYLGKKYDYLEKMVKAELVTGYPDITNGYLSDSSYVEGSVGDIINMSDEEVWSLLTGGAFTSEPSSNNDRSKFEPYVQSHLASITVNVWAWASSDPNDLTKTTKTVTFTVHEEVANLFREFLQDLYINAPDFVINEIGCNAEGRPWENVSSTGFNLSGHSAGTAIDINWNTSANAFGVEPLSSSQWNALSETHSKYETIYTGSPIAEIAQKYTLSWGGTWTSSKDNMHFSFVGDQTRTYLKSQYGGQYQSSSGGGTTSSTSSDTLVGAVKIRRKLTDGTDIRLTYKSPEEFNSLYTGAQSEQTDAKVQNILRCFTVDENWNIIIAKYSKTVVKDTNDSITSTIYSLSKETLSYKELVSKYTMPFEFMFVLLQTTMNPEYVAAVADLAIKQTKIEFTIMDSVVTSTAVKEHSYTENVNVILSSVAAGSTQATQISNTTSPVAHYEKETTITETNSITANITYVKTWIYEKNESYNNHSETTTYGPTVTPFDNQDNVSDSGDKIYYVGEDGTSYYKRTKTSYTDIKDTYTETIQQVRWVKEPNQTKGEINPDLFLGLWKNEYGKYVEGALYSKEKDENGELETVRYTIPDRGIAKYPAESIIEYPDIFFYLLSKTERTQSHELLMRYVLYVYTGKNYGLTEEDLEKLLDIFNINTTYNSFGYGYWWPIACSSHTGQCDSSCTPVETSITSGVGPRWGKNHGGVDIASYAAPNIIASKGGTVIYATPNGGTYGVGYYGSTDGGGYGNYVMIQHDDGYITVYAHMAAGTITVSTGDKVEQGQIIGKMGTSGSSTGIHLHFEIRDENNNRLDPENYVSQSNPRPTGIGGYEDVVWGYLTGKGLTPTQAAGVMGNIKAESGFDPSIVEKGNGIGFGICQWSYGRRTQLESYAASLGKNASDIYLQLDFLWSELYYEADRGSTGASFQWAPNWNSSSFFYQKFINATTVDDATASMCDGWERPTGSTQNPSSYPSSKAKSRVSYRGILL